MVRSANDVKIVRMNPEKSTSTAKLASLTVGAVGVVYGDIGTSPLYAFRESVAATIEQRGSIDAQSLIGITSLVVWALLLIVTLKYVILILRADNHGEGGILSLMTLAIGSVKNTAFARFSPYFLYLGMAGAALFYGDAVITPAIVGTIRTRGPRISNTQLHTLHTSGSRDHYSDTIYHAIQRHRKNRPLLWTHHDAMVYGDGSRRPNTYTR